MYVTCKRFLNVLVKWLSATFSLEHSRWLPRKTLALKLFKKKNNYNCTKSNYLSQQQTVEEQRKINSGLKGKRCSSTRLFIIFRAAIKQYGTLV